MPATRPRVLVVSRWLPAPPDNGARIRRAQLVRALAEVADVEWFALLDAPPDPQAVAAVPARVECFAQPPFDRRAWRARLALVHPTPRAVVATRSAALAARLDEHLAAARPDVLVADEIHTAHAVLGRGIPVLLEELQPSLLADDPGWRGRITWAKNRRYHRRVLAAATVATTPSAAERARLLEIAPRARVEVVPNGVDLDALGPDPDAVVDPDLLVYPGSVQYDANLDAVTWFAREVLPRVRAERPGTRLVVTGATDGVTVPTIEGLELVGRLESIEPLVRSARAVVVPLRRGGGTRIKILEALALGTPVVATTKGAEGLDLAPDVIARADDPAAIAAAIAAVPVDPTARAVHAARARTAAAGHDWATARAGWQALVGELAGRSPGG